MMYHGAFKCQCILPVERMGLQNKWACFCKALDQLRQLELLDILCKTAVVETAHCKVCASSQDLSCGRNEVVTVTVLLCTYA